MHPCGDTGGLHDGHVTFAAEAYAATGRSSFSSSCSVRQRSIAASGDFDAFTSASSFAVVAGWSVREVGRWCSQRLAIFASGTH